MATKVCSRCKRKKNEDRCFYDKKRGNGKTSWCRVCIDKNKNKKSGRKIVAASAYETSLRRKWKNVSYDAKKKGVKSEFTFNEYKDMIEKETNCFYCGYSYQYTKSLFDAISSSRNNTRNIRKLKKSLTVAIKSTGLTLDRMDSFGDYSRENCTMACYLCNSAKGWAIPADQYKLIAPAVIANIIKICTDAGLVI